MNILDAVIIILLLVGALAGFRRGLIKQTVLSVGLIVTIVVAFYLRVPISTFMYKNLPFLSSGIFKDISVLNILLYELIAFLIVFSILYIILRVLIKVSGLIEKIFKCTIILGIFSKIGGAILGVIESYIIVFVLLFIFKQPFINITGIENSKLSDKILESTPIMSDVVEDTRIVINDIYDLVKDCDEKENFNEEAIKLFLKYDIVSQENIDLLREKGKI